MIHDLNEHDGQPIRADVAIVGTGACGLAIASEFLDRDLTVVLLETGGFERSAPAEALNDAELAGSLPVWIRSRSRFLGGSTNCWKGNISPFDRVDFERDWVPEAVWPVGLDDLAPYAEQAHDIFRIGPVDFTIDFWKKRLPRVRDGLLLEESDRVTTKLIQRTNLGHPGEMLAGPIDRSESVSIHLNAQVVNIATTDDGSRVTGLDVVSLDGSRTATVEAEHYVLAAGPENPRLLLASRDQHPDGVGGEHGQVGKWWLAHHSARRGWLDPAPGLDWSLYHLYDWDVGDRQIFGALRISDAVQAEERLFNSAAILETFEPLQSFNTRTWGISAAKQLLGRTHESLGPQELTAAGAARFTAETLGALGRQAAEMSRGLRGKPRRAFIRNWCEQAPHPDNRVELSDQVDRFGVPKMRIVSNLKSNDIATLRRSFEILGEEFERHGLGRLVSDFPKGEWPAGAISTAHFMGGTRMSEKPEDGVVDPECRVHGVDNLWVAGGSVFPTAGVSMVSYTAVLLALRLAHRIADGADANRLAKIGQRARRQRVA